MIFFLNTLYQLKNESIVHLACSGFHTLAVTSNGQVYAWGYNNDGRLGLGSNVVENGSNVSKHYRSNRAYVMKPTLLPFCIENEEIGIESVTAANDHSTMKDIIGNIYVWGCQRSSPIVKYKKREKSVVWTNKLQPFCVTNGNIKASSISSCRRRMVMTGMDGNIYILGEQFVDSSVSDEWKIVQLKEKRRVCLFALFCFVF